MKYLQKCFLGRLMAFLGLLLLFSCELREDPTTNLSDLQLFVGQYEVVSACDGYIETDEDGSEAYQTINISIVEDQLLISNISSYDEQVRANISGNSFTIPKQAVLDRDNDIVTISGSGYVVEAFDEETKYIVLSALIRYVNGRTSGTSEDEIDSDGEFSTCSFSGESI